MEWAAILDIDLRQISELITSWTGIWTISGAIVVLAIGLYVFGFRRRMAQLNRQLKQVTATIEETENAQAFSTAFHDLDEEIRHSPLLADAWRELKGSLLYPEVGQQPPQITSSQPPAHFFRRDALLRGRVNFRLYNALPNLLTGMGILGTFLGLVAGIYLASGGLGSDDIDQAKQAMQELLHGASLAFITSIVGLVSSMLFSWFEKLRLHGFDGLLSQWTRALDERIPRVTQERIARDQLRHVLQQTEVIEGFTNQLAFQIAEQFDQRLQQHVTDSLAPALNRLVDGIEGLRAESQRGDEQVLTSLLERFTEKLEGAAGSEMEALGQTLRQLNDKLQAQQSEADQRHRVQQRTTAESMEKLSAAFNDGSEHLQQRVEKSVAAMSTGVGKLLEQLAAQQQRAETDANQRMKTLGATFSDAASGMRETLTRMQEVTAGQRQITEDVGRVVQALEIATGRVQGLGDPLQLVADQFSAVTSAISEHVDRMAEATQTIVDSTSLLQETSQETRKTWENYSERFEGIDDALGAAFTQLTEGVERFTSQVNDVLSQLDKNAAGIGEHLRGAVQELAELIEEDAETRRQ